MLTVSLSIWGFAMIKYKVVFADEEEFSEIVEARNEEHLIDIFEVYYPLLDVVDYEPVKEEANVL